MCPSPKNNTCLTPILRAHEGGSECRVSRSNILQCRMSTSQYECWGQYEASNVAIYNVKLKAECWLSGWFLNVECQEIKAPVSDVGLKNWTMSGVGKPPSWVTPFFLTHQISYTAEVFRTRIPLADSSGLYPRPQPRIRSCTRAYTHFLFRGFWDSHRTEQHCRVQEAADMFCLKNKIIKIVLNNTFPHFAESTCFCLQRFGLFTRNKKR